MIVSLTLTALRPTTHSHYLPLHLVWAVTLAEREGGGEVGDEELLLLDDGEDGLVDNLLVGGAGGRWHLLLWRLSVFAFLCSYMRKSYLWLLALLEELGLASLLGGTLASEVLLAGDLLDLLGINTGDIDLVGGGDNVAGVDAADWDTVDLEWASDEEDTLVKVVQEDDALATETASEEDENGSWDEGSAWSGGTDGLADLENES